MQKKISFKNNKGQRLVGVLHIPKGQGPFPTVIVQHGFSSNYNDPLVKKICSKLESQKFMAMRFSFSGHKYSQGTYKEVLVSQFVKDIKQAVHFLLKISQVNKNRIGIVGHSMGGFTSLMSINILSKYFKTAVSISSFYDIEALIKHHLNKGYIKFGRNYFKLWDFKVSNNHFEDRLYMRRRYKLKDIHRPVIIIHGDKDETVDVKDSYLIFKLLNEPKELKIIKGADHNFNNRKYAQRVVNLTVSWFKKYLALKISKVINVTLEYNGQILLLKRSQKVGTHAGLWSGVGGYFEKDESSLTAARREVKEELSIKDLRPKTKVVGRPFKLNDTEIDRIWHVHPVLFRLRSKPRIKLDWENSEYRWVKFSEVKRYKILPTMPRAWERLGLIDN